MCWRHEENGWDVVSTFLHEKWDNATHPANHEDFVDASSDDAPSPMWKPKNPGVWETFFSENYFSRYVVDERARRRWKLALSNDVSEKYAEGNNPPKEGPDLTDADAVAEFMCEPFVARLPKDGDFNGTGRYEECDTCDGTGRVAGDNPSGFCTNEKHQEDWDYLHVNMPASHPDCSCDVGTEGDFEECPDCEGEGGEMSYFFHRKFDPVLSEKPKQEVLEVIQNTISVVVNGSGSAPRAEAVIRLFEYAEEERFEDLVEQAFAMMKPHLKADPEVYEAAEIRLRSTMTGLPRERVEDFVTVSAEAAPEAEA